MTKIIRTGLAISAFFFFVPAWASMDGPRILSASAGIASPGHLTSLWENPAGLSETFGTFIGAAADSGSTSFNPLTYDGVVLLGNRSVGGALAYEGYNPSGNSGSLLRFGLAANVDTANLALGVTGTYATTGGAADANAGLIFNPRGGTRVGITAFGLVGGVDAWAAGLAVDLNPNATLALDAATNPGLNAMTVKPGLAIQLHDVQMSAGYGIATDSASAGYWIPTGASLGLGLRLGEKAQLEGYYNQIAKYFLGLTFHI